MTKIERGLSLDTGRKHWTFEELIDLLNLMKEKNFDTFQWHFADFLGFRVKLDSFPEIASEEHLTKEEMHQIIAHAKQLGIKIVPELDTPGHMTPYLEKHKEHGIQQRKEDGTLVYSTTAIDITNEEVKKNVFLMLEEILALFDESTHIHLGADEFIEFSKVAEFPSLVAHSKEIAGEAAQGLESYVAYTNELIAFIRSKGKTPRVWNDGFFRSDVESLISLDQNVEICYWTNWDKAMAPLATWLEKGYKMVNFNDNYLYYVLGEHSSYTYPTAEKIRKDFDKYKFSGEQWMPKENHDQLVATFLAVWSDKPEAKTAREILTDLAPLLEALSEKL